jgi:GMP synthase (glutamine-hydrolysing)
MALRILVVEGNTRAMRASHAAVYGLTPCESFAAVLASLERDLACDFAFPADEGANLPDPAGLAGYDGVVMTGSGLHVYDMTPAVTRQIDLMRAVYAAGVPVFGSCWGLQIATVAAGGEVKRNGRGREIGFARNIAPTEAGGAHPLLAGRPPAFTCPASHLDEVTALPAGGVALATSAFSAVQAVEIRHDGASFWGVQYHPEYALDELAAVLERRADALVAEGFCRTVEDAAGIAADLRALHADPGRRDLAWRYGLDDEVLEAPRRTAELRNFIERRVKPAKSAAGRA